MKYKKIIVISGTPGTGKTTISKRLAKILNGIHIDLSELAIREKLYISYDNQRNSYVIDEEAVVNRIKELAKKYNDKVLIIDSHYGEIIPPELVDKIIVLRIDPLVLENRLREKGWSWNKVKENVAAEILGVCTANAIKEHGVDKVYEVDVTNKDVDDIIREIIKIIKEGGISGPRIDWLSSKSFNDLRKYLE